MKLKNKLFILISLFAFLSCSSGRYLKRADVKTLNEMLGSDELNHHMGFLLKDLATGQVIEEHHSDKYFTPASNTKILSLALGLETLSDSIPFVAHYRIDDTLYIKGLGDPTFLHPDFNSERQLNFLRNAKKVVVDLSNYQDKRYGSGWSWDDYNGAYQIERSSFPIYGNKIIFIDDQPSLKLFEPDINFKPRNERIAIQRNVHNNVFNISGQLGEQREKHVPLVISDDLIATMLQDTLGIEVSIGEFDDIKMQGMVFSHGVDDLYRPMMENSDNFFADQILMMSAQLQNNAMNESEIIKSAKQTFLNTQDELLWYDGSGLSRYNQLTPRAIVQVLENLEKKHGLKRLTKLFPKGGSTGTIKNWYGGSNGTSFVFAKTGTMRNVHCLSGYLIGNSGRWYVFSFMHNNFPGGSSTVKKPMEKILKFLKTEL